MYEQQGSGDTSGKGVLYGMDVQEGVAVCTAAASLTSKHFFACMLAGRPGAQANAIEHYQTSLDGLGIIDIARFYRNNLK